jgi:hypothetical protein
MRLIIRYILCFLTMILVIQCEKDEPQVIIKDSNFLNALIERGIDINGDSIINEMEAAAVKFLDISSCSISDMSGIEAFINLDSLNCGFNQLSTLDVSNNTALLKLYCSNNQLTTLDISNNSTLGLGVGGYSKCFLDIGDMPSLEKVCVWTMPFPPEGFKLCADGSPNVYFTMDCSK